MNAPVAIPRPVAQPFIRETFKVWRVLDNGLSQPHKVAAESLATIEDELATEANYGASFLVLSTDALTGKSTLHTYRIRRGSNAIGWQGARKVYPYVADRLLSVAVAAFDPVEPWRWSPGCDVVGRSNVIEGKSNAHRL